MCISFSFASTSGAGTRLVFLGGDGKLGIGETGREQPDMEYRVTVLLSCESWRECVRVLEPAVDGREEFDSHL